MVSFFVTAEGRFGIDAYRHGRGAALADRLRVLAYDTLPSATALPATGTVFAAIDQIGPAAGEALCRIADAVVAADPAARVLNRPDRALLRYDLLTKLHAEGGNRFRVRRAADGVTGLRFPVFIRSERRHSGSHTPLLHDRAAVDRALATLAVRGRRLSDLLIVEFCDTRGADGLYRKYAALRVGDEIIPRHLHAAPHWVVKSDARQLEDERVREEVEYVTANPHARWLRQVFDLARIEFGRIDYGVWRGEPQVWEINTNPTFGRGDRSGASARRPGAYDAIREQSRHDINDRLLKAFAALERPDPVRAIVLPLPTPLRHRLIVELRRQARDARTARLRSSVSDAPWVRAIKRVTRPTLTALASLALRVRRRRSSPAT